MFKLLTITLLGIIAAVNLLDSNIYRDYMYEQRKEYCNKKFPEYDQSGKKIIKNVLDNFACLRGEE